MRSDVEIVNAALTLLGEGRIMSLAENTKPARESNAIYGIVRDSLISSYNWSFSKSRAALPALVDPPVGEQFSLQYQLPTDCLRVIMVGNVYVGVDLSSYRSAPSSEYSIEGRKILTNFGSPLSVVYASRITDSTQFSASFCEALSTKLASYLAEPLTQSDSKRARAEAAFKQALSNAVRANAIEMPPQGIPDDEWIMSRL